MENYLLISDAAKEVKVESHVLRYWEEELHLPIKRNELGHRYYTQEDVERFRQIKSMKEKGLQLKAIKMILKDGKLSMLPEDVQAKERDTDTGSEETFTNSMPITITNSHDMRGEMSKEEKAQRLQWLFKQMIQETLQESNKELCKEIKESVIKELDYQFRNQEEREEERERQREKRSEEYYQKMDELLRKKTKARSTTKEKEKQEKQEKKRHFIF